MTWELAEGVVGEIIKYLDTNLNTKVEAFSAQFNDKNFKNIKEFIYDEDDLSITPSKDPICFVVADTGLGLNFSDGGDIFRGSYDVRIGIIVSSNAKKNRRQLYAYRYGKALLETVNDGMKAGLLRPVEEPLLTFRQEEGQVADVVLSWTFLVTETR